MTNHSKYKYPRTPHLPWSLAVQSDDVQKKAADLGSWQDRWVIATEKMDGENTNVYADGSIHARSLDSKDHPSRHWLKQWWSERAHDLPEGWRVCGENMYARHSIAYAELPHYFMGFSIWDEKNLCLSWDETIKWFKTMGIEPVRVLYDGVFDESKLRQLWSQADNNQMEGYVVRPKEAFLFEEFDQSVAKMVRKGHVQTDSHWMHQKLVPNGLRPKPVKGHKN